MFGLGFGELIMIGIIIILFTRPEDLPILVRKAGQMYGKFMQIYYSFLDEINDISELKK